MARIFATTDPEMSKREIVNMNRSRAIASQGMVLLKNEGALPLKKDAKKIALFGNGVRYTIKGGTGSGDVNSRFVVNLEKAMLEAGYELTSADWLERYDQKRTVERKEYFAMLKQLMEEDFMKGMHMLLDHPYQNPNSFAILESDLEADVDAAVYCIARNSGEAADRTAAPGDYYLEQGEMDNIQKLIDRYGSVSVVLNVGGVLDTTFLRNTPGIDAILLASQAGNITGYAIADVLSGKVTPSGHLTTTWAKDYKDYPFASEFSSVNGNNDDEYYREGIFVGYRYFDTFGIEPAYPFGYGLSYTDFAVVCESVSVEGRIVTVNAAVTNTGKGWSGKEVVQVYASAPDGILEKPYQELVGFAKTKDLAPGETEILSIVFDAEQLASYDEKRASYIIEPGTYYVRMGTNSRNTAVVAALTLAEEVITENLTNVLPLDCEMEVISKKGAIPYGYEGEASEKAAAPEFVLNPAAFTTRTAQYITEFPEMKGTITDHVVTLDEVKEGKASLEDLIAQLTVPEMADICNGVARGGFGEVSIVGAASALVLGAAGDTTSNFIQSRKIPNMSLVDGPAGLRLAPSFAVDKDGNLIPDSVAGSIGGFDEAMGKKEVTIPEDATWYYQYATAIPIATLLAMSWDESNIEAAGAIVGEEMKELGCTLWLAPGMNIHRNPLCGRNFEYYSEDPLLSGKCAAADTRGVQKFGGIGTTIKHFAFNNQEDNRSHVNAHVAERTAREIYLKGFEIAVKEAQPLSIMTSYNLANGVHTANRYDIITTVARQEWGFEGVFMTDWGTTSNHGYEGKYGCSNSAGCIAAGNDLTMPGSQKDVDDIIAAVGAKEGEVLYPLTLGQLQDCVKNVLKVVMKC